MGELKFSILRINNQADDFSAVDSEVFSGFEYGIINNVGWFDATNVLKNRRTEVPDEFSDGVAIAQNFLEKSRNIIEAVVISLGIRESDVFALTQDKHILINANLDTAFLSYCHPEYLAEAMEHLRNVATFNFSVADSVLMSLANRQLPDEAIEEIIKNRK